MFYDTIKSIAEDLSKYSNLTREQFFTVCVNQKLDKQLDKYMHTLTRDATWANSISFGQAKVELFKNLTKIQIREAEKIANKESEK